MSGERPRPQFGEYATPEEQRAHIREPLPEPIVPLEPAPAPQRASYPAPASGLAGAPVKPAPDRIVTLVLLGLGIANVLTSAPALLKFQETITKVFVDSGVEREIASSPRDGIWGFVLAAVLVFGLAITVYVCWQRMKAGKLSWWIAVLGAVITMIVFTTILGVVLAGDPAMAELVRMSVDGQLPIPTETP